MFRFLLLLSCFLCWLPYPLSVVGQQQPAGSQTASRGKVVTSNGPLEHELPGNVTDWEIYPQLGLEVQIFNYSRRNLGSFQICALCTCCGEGRRFCIPTACCYTITCGSPDRPFGFCSFQPVSCNCINCRL